MFKFLLDIHVFCLCSFCQVEFTLEFYLQGSLVVVVCSVVDVVFMLSYYAHLCLEPMHASSPHLCSISSQRPLGKYYTIPLLQIVTRLVKRNEHT